MAKRNYNRAQRVADHIQKNLATILLQEMGDQRFQRVTVTGVTLSRDLSYAKVYVSVLSEEDSEVKSTVKALNAAAKIIRFHLAKMLELRVTPELRFIYDESTAHGFRINELIRKNDQEQNE